MTNKINTSPVAVELAAYDLEDDASRDNMGVMYHPAASMLRALSARLAEVEAERDEMAERIEDLERACEVVSSEFEGELWQACRRLLQKTHFDF